MATVSTSTLDNQLSSYYIPKALITLVNETPLREFAEIAPLPGNKGTTVYWNAWTYLAGASGALSEGGSNTAAALSSRRVSATIAQYGRGHTITDLALYATILDSKNGAQMSLRQSAKETYEQILHTGIFK